MRRVDGPLLTIGASCGLSTADFTATIPPHATVRSIEETRPTAQRSKAEVKRRTLVLVNICGLVRKIVID